MKKMSTRAFLMFSLALVLLTGWMLGAQAQSGTGSITLNWTAYDPGDASLSVWYGVILFDSDDERIEETISGTSITISNLTAGAEYTWFIDVYTCAAGQRMPDCTLVDGVLDSGASIAEGIGEIALSWSAAIDPAQGTVWYVVALGDQTVTTDQTSATFGRLVTGDSYDWMVIAHSCLADDVMPDCAQIGLHDSGTSTAASDGASVDQPAANGAIAISWQVPTENPIGGALWYMVEVSVQGIDSVTTDRTSATVTGLTVGLDYDWDVYVFSCLAGEVMPNCAQSGSQAHASGTSTATAGARLPSTGGGSGGSPGGGGNGGDGDGGSSSGGGSSDSSSRSSGSGEASAPSAPRSETYIDHNVQVSGGVNHQPVTGSGIGNADVIAQGVISATDVWGTVPAGTRVCFLGRVGGVMFLDAATTPRALSWLEHAIVGVDTCVDLPGAGTVVLVKGPDFVAAAAAQPAAPAAVDDAAPVEAQPQPAATGQPICHIKLTNTVFLRARPWGQALALVWLNTEVPVFASEGDWHYIEFEGQYGYISRHYSKRLSGSC